MRRERTGGLRLLLGLAAVAAMTMALVSPSAAATGDVPLKDAHQGASYEDFLDEDECEGVELGEGEILWHFILSPLEVANTGTHTLTWDGTYPGRTTGKAVHFVVINGEETVPASVFASSDNISEKTELRVSHTCGDGGGYES